MNRILDRIKLAALEDDDKYEDENDKYNSILIENLRLRQQHELTEEYLQKINEKLQKTKTLKDAELLSYLANNNVVKDFEKLISNINVCKRQAEKVQAAASYYIENNF